MNFKEFRGGLQAVIEISGLLQKSQKFSKIFLKMDFILYKMTPN